MMNKIKIGLIFGGRSAEHEVSITSAKNILAALDRSKYAVTAIAITRDGRFVTGAEESVLNYALFSARQEMLPNSMLSVYQAGLQALKVENGQTAIQKLEHELLISRTTLPDAVHEQVSQAGLLSKLDVIFPVLHGTFGEDGVIQALIRMIDVACVGCGVAASAVAMDKILTKQCLDAAGIPQVKWTWTNSEILESDYTRIETIIASDFGGYPVFTKPANTGSSIGIIKVKSRTELLPALREAARYDRRILVEQAFKGRELEIAVLGNQRIVTSPCTSEIIPKREFYDYIAKYQDDSTETVCPAPLTEDCFKRIQAYAIQAFRAIDGAGMARIDFFFNENTNEIVLNEINTIPGFTSISQYPSLMLQGGYTYAGLIEELIQLALERQESLKRLEI
ncbi:D-alanine--D-alanine ligase [bacterium]|nr:D-alanine--D-alanine ligase [bacterium]